MIVTGTTGNLYTDCKYQHNTSITCQDCTLEQVVAAVREWQRKNTYSCCNANPQDNTGHASYCHTRTMDDEIVREMMDADVRFDREVEEHEQYETHSRAIMRDWIKSDIDADFEKCCYDRQCEDCVATA